MAVADARFLRIVDALAEVERTRGRDYTSFSVLGRRFGYHWPRTSTTGLKQTLSEQLALVSERPDVFEVQFTAGGFGWVVVHLPRIGVDELTELVYEAWRLSAPESLVEQHPNHLALLSTADTPTASGPQGIS
ncbi:MmcQ/YjbR family DNA-binding protein [Actinophytocola xanthii]|uniref:MmcQ/YjbR family DNA-binding protein n=1 Tax=Actinophytocola xanthii TaxID=1912961 RepID=UPI001E58B8DE|nr:MmcQ/YjbR family DNA-binding protein [Actinophytocola xanthii]